MVKRLTALLLLLLTWTQPVYAATTFLDPGTAATFGTELWTTGHATFSSDASTAGAPSIKALTDGTNFAYGYSPNGVASNAGGRYSVFVYLPSVSPAAEARLLWVQNASDGATKIWAVLHPSGKVGLQIESQSTVYAGSPTTLSTNTLTQITIAWTWTSTTVNQFRLYINGNLEVTLSNVTTGSFSISGVAVGVGSPAGANFACYFQHIYVDNSTALTDPGNIRVTAKRPNANGTTNGFLVQIGSGGSGYGSGHSPQVNERALSTTNGWSTALLSTTEEYSIENAATGDADLTGATIVDFMGWLYAKASTSVTAQMILAGSNSNVSLTTANKMFTKAAGSTTYPAGSTDIGMISSGSAGTDSLYECGIIFAYIPSAGAPAVNFFPRRRQ